MTTSASFDIVSDVGRLLKEARIAAGLTLDDAASRADLSVEHLREVEDGFLKPKGGERRGPSIRKVERIANVYGLTVRFLPLGTAGRG